MRRLLLLMPLGATAVHAMPVEDPVAVPEHGRFALSAQVDGGQRDVVADACADEADCQARHDTLGVGIRGDVALARGAGLFAQVHRSWETIDEAAYGASGLVVGGGARAAIPLGGISWVGLVGEFAWGSLDKEEGEEIQAGLSEDEEESDESSDEDTDDTASQRMNLGTRTLGRVSLLYALHSREGDVSLYLGPTVVPLYAYDVEVLTDGLTYTFDPASRLGGVLGATLASPHLGLPWSGQETRFRFGVELRYEAGPAGSTHFAVSF